MRENTDLKIWNTDTFYAVYYCIFNPFQTNVSFLYPLKMLSNLWFFLKFSGGVEMEHWAKKSILSVFQKSEAENKVSFLWLLKWCKIQSFLLLCVQSYFINIQSSFLYSVSHLICIQSHLIFIQSTYMHSVSSYLYSVKLYIFSPILFLFSFILFLFSQLYIFSLILYVFSLILSREAATRGVL